MKFLLLSCLIYLFATSAIADAVDSNQISNKLQIVADNYLKQYGNKEHISAISLTVKTRSIEKPVTVQSGHIEFNGEIPVNASNLYQIGSITKSFIAAILLQIEADPKYHFNINNKVKEYLPEYPKWGEVTVKQLLNMTSRIPNYTDDEQFNYALLRAPLKDWRAEELVNLVYDKPMIHDKNKFYYSNTNYILAGMIITRLTGHTVEEEMNERFLNNNDTSHLMLNNTYYVSHLYPEQITNRLVHGYYFKNVIMPPTTDVTYSSLSWASAAGAIVANTDEITTWIESLYVAGKILPAKQLKELTSLVSVNTGEPLTQLTENDPDGFGLGIGSSYDISNPADLIYNYEGSTKGYRAEYMYIPTKGLIISAAVNSSVDDENDHISELMDNTYNAIKN